MNVLQALPRSHRISDELRAEILEQLQLKVPDREIQRRSKDKLLDKYMSDHNLTDRREALKAYCSSQSPRDWSLSLQDIANVRREADKATWRFDENPQTSVKMWKAQNPGAVLYMDEQMPLPGTADYAHMQRAQEAAAKGSWGELGKRASAEHDSSAAAADEAQPEEAEEYAFRGAEDSLDRPELIDLDRAEQPALVQNSLTDAEGATFNFDPLNWTAFSIAIMTQEGVEAAKKWGHLRPLQMDSTFGCNAQKFPLITLLVVDGHGKGVPVAHCICSQETVEIIQKFLEAVTRRVRTSSDVLRN